jgi:three-Cys-motif partner protein
MGRRTSGKTDGVTAATKHAAPVKSAPDPNQGDFGFPEAPAETELPVVPPAQPIWTENKAKLIERYLYYFVLVTKHGTYIDGFAGPQNPDQPETWAAKLVLESEPRWLRKFFLCDIDLQKVRALEQLRDAQPKKPKRKIEVHNDDFNVAVDEVLRSGAIKEKEAAFCLLDQRTFECKWSTVERLARHKAAGHKIELFYFLAQWWFDRSFKSKKDREPLREWWGRDDLERLGSMNGVERARLICERLRKELGYKHARPWAIYERANGGHVAYYMIHASDHDAAPRLMSRAYRKAVTAKEPLEQLRMGFMREQRGDAETQRPHLPTS